MLLNDQLVPVIGNVCMDMTMLDITGLDAMEGDEVIVFGENLPVTKIAGWAEPSLMKYLQIFPGG